jgi:hypothetical protein
MEALTRQATYLGYAAAARTATPKPHMPSMAISRRAPVNQQRAELVCPIVTVTKAWLSSICSQAWARITAPVLHRK